MKLKILAQTRTFVAIHKPSGLLTYGERAPGAKELLERQIGREVFPVHRIDKDTCGILLFAFTNVGASELTKMFSGRNVRKRYVCVVHGTPPGRGVINEPLERNKSKVKDPALTEYVRLATTEVEWDGEKRQYSLVCCEIKTGRFHQIRRHMRFIGHPVCGDPLYGNGWNNRAFKERFGTRRTLLCAVAADFLDRHARRPVELRTRPDPDFQKVLKAFGWRIELPD